MNEFRATTYANRGFQKLNKFRLYLPVPDGLNGIFRGRNNGQDALTTSRNLAFMCSSTDLPQLGLATRPIMRYGYGNTEKKPFAPMFTESLITVYNDGQENNLQFFHDWLRLICRNDFGHSIGEPEPIGHSISYPYELAYLEEYAVDARVRLYDNHGKPKYEMILRECWPMVITATRMSWEPVQTIMSLTLMLAYADWDVDRDVFDFDPDPTTGTTNGGVRGPGQPLGALG